MASKKSEYTYSWKRKHPERARESHRKAQLKWRTKNREKVRSTKKAWSKLNRKKENAYRRNYYYLQLHGITAQAADDVRTHSRCEICGSCKRLVFDHDHISMKPRGILCDSCNKGLGLLGDNEDSIQRTLAYLGKTC
jgi:hypothetical protein